MRAHSGHRSRAGFFPTRMSDPSFHRADGGTSGSRARPLTGGDAHPRLPHGHPPVRLIGWRTPAAWDSHARVSPGGRGRLGEPRKGNRVAAAPTAPTRVGSRRGRTRGGTRPRGQWRRRHRAPRRRRRRRRRVDAGAGGHRRAGVAPHAADAPCSCSDAARGGGAAPPPPPRPRADPGGRAGAVRAAASGALRGAGRPPDRRPWRMRRRQRVPGPAAAAARRQARAGVWAAAGAPRNGGDWSRLDGTKHWPQGHSLDRPVGTVALGAVSPNAFEPAEPVASSPAATLAGSIEASTGRLESRRAS